MRLLIYLAYWFFAFLVGFMVRARYDTWMYSKFHMQARLRVFAAEVVMDEGDVGERLYFPPCTTDHLAMSPARTEAFLQQYAYQRETGADGAAEESPPSSPPAGVDDGPGSPPGVGPIHPS